MGLFRRKPLEIDYDTLATAIAAKAVVPGLGQLPAGATTTDLIPLVREAFGSTSLFGPGIPLTPHPVDHPWENTGHPAPRTTEFTVSANLNLQGPRLVPFKVLRDTAERVDVIRACIRTRVAHLLALDWDITLTKQSVKTVMADDKIASPGKAWQLARERFEPDAGRLRDWWQKPDRYNNLDFASWLSMLLEEQLALDATTIWPRYNLKGDVGALEQIDGATIKPLLDYRGAVPQPPAPAYQQILYGFPRGDWMSSTDGVEDTFSQRQLVYRPRNRRAWTPYGFSEVEQALSAVDLFLKRIGWIRGEYDDGTTPKMWMETDVAVTGPNGLNPDQLAGYEAFLNGELAGQDAARRAIHLLPKGMVPKEMREFADMFNPDLDELIIKLVCMTFAVLPTEIGFPPKSGIGGKGHQEGEANSAYRRDIRPSVVWCAGLLTDLSREFLKMPAELEFSFLDYEVEDQTESEHVKDSQVRRGGMTVNESRGKAGLPLWEFDEADEPFLVTGSGLVFLRGAMAAQAAAPGAEIKAPKGMPEPAAGTPEATPAPAADPASATDPRPGAPGAADTDPPVPDGHIRVSSHTRRKPTAAQQAVIDEAAKFATFTTRRAGRGWRDFTFDHVSAGVARRFNDLGRAGDLEAVKALVADVGKAEARTPGTPSAKAKQAVVDKHAKKLAAAARAAVPAGIVERWLAAESDTAVKVAEPESEREARARAFAEDELDDDFSLGDDVEEFYDDAYDVGLDGQEVDDRGRLSKLLDDHADLIAGLVLDVAVTVAGALISTDPNVDAALDTWAAGWASVNVTAPVTAGVLDGAQAQGLENVRLVVGDGCPFCDDYDGRIMSIDDESGMPPLHAGCSCDLEPLDPRVD